MPDSPKDTDRPQSSGDDLTTSSAGSLPDLRGSDSATTDHLPDGRNFLEEPPTVISTKKGHVTEGNSRSYSLAELTVGRELVGQTLGHFQLDAFVGAGGMGAVFRGHDTQLNRRVAVKVLSGEHNTKEETVRRFRNEAQSAARLDHPNIARVYFVGEDKGWNYIVFEYIDGTNIRDEVERSGPLEIELAISYLVQVAEALDHAQIREVVHRDIKPSNILVDSQHRAKLVDMGLARLHQVNSQDSDLTASGMTLGTFDYISPEQARDPRSADVRSDLYSLGCTFFFMLTGRPPFPEGTVLQKLLSHSGEEPPDPREFRADVPDEVVHILSRLMAKNPNDRFQKPGELIAAALMVIDELNLAAPHVTASVYVPTTEQRSTVIERHLPWVLPTISLLVLVFVVDTIWTAQDDSMISGVSYTNASQLMTPLTPTDDGPTETNSGSPPPANNGQPVTPIQDTKPATETSRTMSEMPPVMNIAQPKPTPEATIAAETPMPMTAPADMTGTNKPKPPAADVAKNVIVVPGDSPTLYEAITRAQADPTLDTIELRYDGEKDERPLLIDSGSLTIRAATGYSPTIVFRPQEFEPLSRMIQINSASLSLKQVQVKMALPPASMRTWSLFGLENANELSLDGCQVVVQREDEMMVPEALRRSTSVISVRATPVEEVSPFALSTARYAVIDVRNSMVHGEASLLRTNGQQALKVTCDNCLLALSGNLLSSVSTTSDDKMNGFVRMKLDFCTIDTAGSLIRREGATSIPLRVTMANCAATWGASLPMVVQRSTTKTPEEITKSLDFSLEDNAYATNTSNRVMLLIESTVAPAAKVEYDLATWRMAWDDLFSQPSDSIWANLPLASRLYSSRVPQDYVLLNDLSGNPALRPDERNAGVDFSLLPFVASPLAGATSDASAATN
ncbi:protein kinase [Bremerella sp. JC817]|uniref:serine/threonine protein kinase n=1 Tax=Bremerella sp. JC817 TaxID=3231756 RepID=UPI00345A4556